MSLKTVCGYDMFSVSLWNSYMFGDIRYQQHLAWTAVFFYLIIRAANNSDTGRDGATRWNSPLPLSIFQIFFFRFGGCLKIYNVYQNLLCFHYYQKTLPHWDFPWGCESRWGEKGKAVLLKFLPGFFILPMSQSYTFLNWTCMLCFFC